MQDRIAARPSKSLGKRIARQSVGTRRFVGAAAGCCPASGPRRQLRRAHRDGSSLRPSESNRLPSMLVQFRGTGYQGEL
jgi:hypothetical protein